MVMEGVVKLKPNDKSKSVGRENWYFLKGHVMYVAGSLFMCAQPFFRPLRETGMAAFGYHEWSRCQQSSQEQDTVQTL